ncbi:porin [Cupriavidus basilensis]|uniref:porin n=1 Tax=Cupriavidus basilensis TaxID=68895 RepID=UPI0039F72F0D
MKKSAFLLPALAVFTGVASAQSSVNLFGVADVAVRRVSNGVDPTYSMGSGGLAASRWGIRAQEDLGGGMAAGAWLEGTVNVDDGSGNSARFWNRRSTVSLMGPLGEVRLGHDLTPGYTSFAEFDTFGVSGLADQGKFYSTAFGSGIEATGLWARADNMVSYFTPNSLGGFYANLAVALGERKPAQKYTGGRVGYATGPVNVTVAYSVFDGLGGNLTRAAVAGSYDLKVAKFLGSIVRSNYIDASRLVAQVGVVVPVGQAGNVRANYTRVNESGTLNGASINQNHATQIAVGYTYEFSKRTTLYATLVSLSNAGNAAFGLGTPPAGRLLRGAEFGMSHRF